MVVMGGGIFCAIVAVCSRDNDAARTFVICRSSHGCTVVRFDLTRKLSNTIQRQQDWMVRMRVDGCAWDPESRGNKNKSWRNESKKERKRMMVIWWSEIHVITRDMCTMWEQVREKDGKTPESLKYKKNRKQRQQREKNRLSLFVCDDDVFGASPGKQEGMRVREMIDCWNCMKVKCDARKPALKFVECWIKSCDIFWMCDGALCCVNPT